VAPFFPDTVYNGNLFTATILRYLSSSTILVRVQTPKTSLAVSSHTTCPLWLAAKVLRQAGGLTVPEAARKHVDVNRFYLTRGSSMSDK